jgi:hypothetical protein
VQQNKDPRDTFPGDPEITYFPDAPKPHVHVKIPWRSRGAPDTALFKRALYVYWDEGHGAPASYRPRVFQVMLDQSIINKDLDQGPGQGDMEYRLFLEVGGRYLFANEIPSDDNILEEGLGDTGSGETWGIHQTVIVFMPPAPDNNGTDYGFRVHSGGWEADGANEAFGRLLDPTIPQPCSWPYYNGVQDFLTDVLFTAENYFAGGRDDPIGEGDRTFTNENPPFNGNFYVLQARRNGLWDDGQERYDVNDAHQVEFQVIERSLDDILR